MLTNTAFIGWIGQQVFCQCAVQVHQRVTVELGNVNVFNQQFNGCFMVQDHLCINGSLAASGLSMLYQLTRI